MQHARRPTRALAVLFVGILTAAACGTRLPDSAFVAAGADGGTGTAAGSRTGTATGSGGTVAGTGTGGTATGGGTSGGGTTGGDGTSGGTGDGGTGGGGTDGPNQASDVGITETEIVIGNITAVDGILGDAFAPPLRGLQAFVSDLNDRGGVHGRTIRLESCNDSEDRTKTLACAQDLVENKKVFAFVANNTRSEGGGVPYIDSQGVPIFMALPIGNAAYRFPHYWSMYGTGCPRDGVSVCVNDTIYNSTESFRWFKEKLGVRKAAVFYYGLIAISADAGAFVMQGLQLEGFEVKGYDVNFANPNFDQAVQEMKGNGTDIILDVIDDGTNRKLCKTMERYDLRVPAKVSTVVSFGDEIGTDFSAQCRDSIYITGSTMAYSDRSNPAVDEFRRAFETYQPGVPLHQWSLEGWMAGKALVEAISSMGSAPTRAGLEAWLNGLNKYTNNGLSVPLDFVKVDYPNTPTSSECTAIAQWQDSVQGWIQRTSPYDCFDGVFQYGTKPSDRGD